MGRYVHHGHQSVDRHSNRSGKFYSAFSSSDNDHGNFVSKVAPAREYDRCGIFGNTADWFMEFVHHHYSEDIPASAKPCHVFAFACDMSDRVIFDQMVGRQRAI